MAEASRLTASTRTRARRSHAERTADTRAKIMAAVVESISEQGLQRTTANEIAQRAGVTWGAVQHHFGAKDGILHAVLEDSFQRFAQRLEGVALEGLPLAARVRLFLEGAWAHFASAHYRSTFEILLNAQARNRDAEPPSWAPLMFRAWDRVWRRFFGDALISRRRHYALQHYTIAVLSGLASMLRVEGEAARLKPGELDLLADTLVRELAQRRAR